jgi:type II secretory pathway pseudopilin PulG
VIYTTRNISIPGNKGLTLLEIMLAMLMLATVVTMVSISISGSLRVVDATEKQGEVYYRAQVALQRISEDLSSALLVDNIEFSGNNQENDSGRGNILEFTSTAHVVFDVENDHPGIALISYLVKPDKEKEGTFVLLRRDNLLTPSDTAETFRGDGIDAFLLCDRLRAIKFTYVNKAGEELDSWTSSPEDLRNEESRKLPVSVKVTLEFWLDDSEENSIVFTTAVLLPIGLIDAQLTRDGKNA